MNSSQQFSSFRHALPWIVFTTMAFFINNVCRMTFNPLLLPIEQEFGIDHTAATTLLLILSTGAGISLFFNGFVSSVIPHRRVIPLSNGCLGIALWWLSLAQDLATLQVGFLVFGLSTGLYLASGLATLGSLADTKFWGKTIAVHELAPNLAFIVAPLLAEATLMFTDWRGTSRILGTAALCMSAAFLLFGKGGNFKGSAPVMRNLKTVMYRSETWMFALLLIVAVALEFGPYSVMPLFLVTEKGMDQTVANSLLSASRLSTPALAIAGGWLCDKVGDKPVLKFTLVANCAALAGLAFTEGWLLGGFIFLQAVFPALMFPAIFKLLAEQFPATEQTLVLNLTMPLVSFFAGCTPAMLGFFGDLGNFGTGFLILAVASILCLPVLKRYGTPQSA